jgi:hypothetical protein
MIAALLVFGVPGGLAVVAVLSYPAFAFWLPTIPGALAYARLRRSVKEWSGARRGAAPAPRVPRPRSPRRPADSAMISSEG